ncbi:LysR family transcriptional regulator [Thioclava dalianensis]|uniref:LysR family transcriptional regulator n=1 Tax=Thioclava dalianensis TaxID=1185766 RepID=A0A074TL40_9RHOB|nr:LysR family transcriptional regulator [Thioclava dalianensis]KEP70890.1 LysR family transcriptional regulator [Thioclava dalianensis]SFN13188.1 DNA-binding transcriptional regulator, LysR family [Thioclava dalianensis]
MPPQPPRVSLWAVEVFTATAEEGAITAAARRLGVSAPTVSQQLAALETALGAELVDRSARPFALTVAGQGFLPHAEAMLEALAQGRAGVALADPSGLTSFRLGMIEDFEAEVTPELLAGMASELTQCRFELETGPSHRLLSLLETRGLDVAVAALPENGLPDGTELHPLLQEPFLVVRPENAPRDLPFIHYSERTLMGRQIAAHLAREGHAPGHRLALDSYPAILALVAAGQGWTILTPSGVRHAPRAGLVLEPLPGAPLSRRIVLAARAGGMGGLPGQVAERLRGLLAARVVTPALRDAPWLGDTLRIEGADQV